MATDREDNVIHVGGSKEVSEMNERRNQSAKMKRTGMIVVIFLLMVIGGVSAFVYLKLRNFRGYKVIHTAETVFEANAEYLEFGSNLLKYTPDGVSYIDANGNIVWTAGVDLKVPIAKTNGDYAVVADRDGNLVAVFSVEGQVSSVNMPYAIRDVDIAKQGAFTAILESDSANYINMYDKNGNIIYEIQTSIDKSGYPMDVSVSDDGKKLITSYFKLDGVNIENNLTAYNFGEVGQNENADRMVGGYSFDEEMIPKVEFVTNDIFAAFSDSKVSLYNMKEKPSERGKIDYNGEISSVFYCGEYLGIIMPNSDAGSNAEYEMHVYDLSGKKLYDYSFNMKYDKIHASNEELIITGGNQCLIIQKNGRTKFSYTFDTMIKSMIATARPNEYVVTFENRTEIIRLKTEDK